MTLLLQRSSRPLFRLGVVSSVAIPFAIHKSRQPPLLCDPAVQAPFGTASEARRGYQADAKVPVVKDGRLNGQAITQFSTGSILGVAGGLAIATFSKTLAVLIGFAICSIQWLASKGYITLETSHIQRYIGRRNLRAALQDNVAFKLGFGLTFALAGFASF